MVEYKVRYRKYVRQERWYYSPMKRGIRDIRGWFGDYTMKYGYPAEYELRERKDSDKTWHEWKESSMVL